MDKDKRKILGHSLQYRLLEVLNRTSAIPSALLLWGPESIGKKFVALKWIKSIYCEAEQIDGCDRCRGCLLVNKRAHPDVMVLEKDKDEILVDDIREVQRFAITRPIYGDKKFILIDNAENMNIVAANMFLKVLEEPPFGVHFILVTSRVKMLLPTVRSRCMPIHFGGLSSSEVEGHISLDDMVYESGFSPLVPFPRGEISQLWEKFLFRYSGRPFILKDRDIIGFRMIAMGLHDILMSLLEESFLSYNVVSVQKSKMDISLWMEAAEEVFQSFKWKDITNLSLIEAFLSAKIRRVYGGR